MDGQAHARAAQRLDVSLGTWTLITANAMVWLVRGFLIHHLLLPAARLLQLPCPVNVFWRAPMERSASRRALHPAPTEPMAR